MASFSYFFLSKGYEKNCWRSKKRWKSEMKKKSKAKSCLFYRKFECAYKLNLEKEQYFS